MIARLGISANAVSYFGVVLSILSALSFFYSRGNQFVYIYLAIGFMGLSGLADMIDGSVARATTRGKKLGKYGAVVDPVMDRYAELFFVLGIMVSEYVPPELVLFCFGGMILSSYTRARAESLGPGPNGQKLFISAGIERKEKIFFLSAGAFLEAFLIQFGLTFWPYFDFGSFRIGPMAWGVGITAVLSHLATGQRLHLSRKYLS